MKKLLKINRTELAKELGISVSYVSKILLGHRKAKKYEEKIQEIKKQNPKAA